LLLEDAYGVITSLNGKSITTSTTLMNTLRAMSPGTRVTVGWVDQYGGSNHTSVKLAGGLAQ
jgi:S1-C subfamily serine protease